MKKAICIEAVAAIRVQDSPQAQMVSQALYGESMDVLELSRHGAKIALHADGQQGWVALNQIALVEDDRHTARQTKVVTKRFLETPIEGLNCLLSMGSELESNVSALGESPVTDVKVLAESLLGAPFLEGGRSCFGLDGPALVQLVFKSVGLYLPRQAEDQSALGEVLSFVEESQIGDLAFFENNEGQIDHAGIMIEDQKIIHAYGRVRLDRLDSSGIFNTELNAHSHKLRFIKRILT